MTANQTTSDVNPFQFMRMEQMLERIPRGTGGSEVPYALETAGNIFDLLVSGKVFAIPAGWAAYQSESGEQ